MKQDLPLTLKRTTLINLAVNLKGTEMKYSKTEGSDDKLKPTNFITFWSPENVKILKQPTYLFHCLPLLHFLHERIAKGKKIYI